MMSRLRPSIELLAVSAAALALELALIRWIPAEVRVIAYFPNIVLLASFLGLGLGALRRDIPLAWCTPALVLLVGTAVAMSRVAFTSSGVSDHLWLLYYDLPKDSPTFDGVVAPVFVVFALTVLTFVPLGAAIGSRLRSFQQEGRTLLGYALDLGGSLTGVLVFLLLAALRSTPLAWFTVALLPINLLAGTRRARLATAALSLLTLSVAWRSDDADRYSPYYALRVLPSTNTAIVLTNGSYHQVALDLRESPPRDAAAGADPTAEPPVPRVDSLRGDAMAAVMRPGMQMPLRNMRRLPQRALVLGAGTGNDVTVLLDMGVPEVHAVEIDPEIVAIGRRWHPAQPYSDPRVVVHVMDARRFLESTDLEFDYIVIATLDSMTRLSALSNVRLDNFVYTRESLEAAKRRLSPEGGLAMFFLSPHPYVADHLYAILDQAFGRPPLAWRHDHGMFNLIYLAGPAFQHLESVPELVDSERAASREQLEAPTDDWPYLYLVGRSIPVAYLTLIGLVLAFAVVGVFVASRDLRDGLARGDVDWEMALFGAAFLLLETSFVTDMNLVFGASWKTSGIVFAAILLAVLVATLVAARVRVPAEYALPVVVVALLVFAVIPLRSAAPVEPAGRVAFAILACGIPVGFAGLAFAAAFRERPGVEAAFGWNLLGAVVGGLLEFSSMAIGLRALFLLAAAIYLSLLLMRLRRKARAPESARAFQASSPS